MSTENSRSVLDGLYHEFLRRGIHYFLPSGGLRIIGHTHSTPQIVFHSRSDNGTIFDWLGNTYELITGPRLTDHKRRMIQAICVFLSTRYELLFDRVNAARDTQMFGGLPEDRYVSAFLDPRVFADATSAVAFPDRASEAIEVLRISALSSYEDKRISTGALLFGSLPDSCHPLPPLPRDALRYSSELTSIRSFHRICDGLRTIALVDRTGLMVELVDIQQWAEPFSGMDLPVPAARRYRTHSQATLCGGHICLVLTPNGEIKIFGEGVQLFSFFDGRWRLTDAVSKYEAWEAAIGRRDLAERLFSAALNLAEHRRGGMFVVLDDPSQTLDLVSDVDLLDADRAEPGGPKKKLHYLLRCASATELSPAVLESIAQIDGSVVLAPDSTLLAFGAILRHRPLMDQRYDIGEGGRTAAAVSASLFGKVLMVSEGGQISFYQMGHSVWTF